MSQINFQRLATAVAIAIFTTLTVCAILIDVVYLHVPQKYFIKGAAALPAVVAVPPSVKITYPTGGEKWERDSAYMINWTVTGTIPESSDTNVAVFCYNSFRGKIQQVGNTGDFSSTGENYSVIWTSFEDPSGDYSVPKYFNDCYIKTTIFLSGNNKISVMSNHFSLIDKLPLGSAPITIVSPNGGETWHADVNNIVTLKSSGRLSHQAINLCIQNTSSKLEYCLVDIKKGGSDYFDPGSGTNSFTINTYDWISIPAGQYVLRVENSLRTVSYTVSAKPFTIVTPNRCCSCVYQDYPQCAKIKGASTNWKDPKSICTSCSYNTAKTPTTAQVACENFLVDNELICSWDAKEGCISRYKGYCNQSSASNYNSKNPASGNCDNWYQIADPGDATQKNQLITNFASGNNCKSFDYFEKEVGVNVVGSAIYKGIVSSCKSGTSGRCALIKASCLTPDNQAKMEDLATCIQNVLVQKKDDSTTLTATMSNPDGVSDSFPSEVVDITSKTKRYNLVGCNQFHTCQEQFKETVCSDNVTGNPAVIKCCPDLVGWIGSNWAKITYDNLMCPGTFESYGTAKGCAVQQSDNDEKYANYAWSDYAQQLAKEKSDCYKNNALGFISKDPTDNYTVGASKKGFNYCVSADWTCVTKK